MTKFEDQLLDRLMAEHGHELRAVPRPAPAPAPRRAGAWGQNQGQVRVRVRRPVWLAAGAAGTVAAVTAGVMTLGSAPALAAYSVTGHDGAVTVSVYRASGVAGANAVLHRMHARVVVVPVRPGCPAIGSLPRPDPVPHPDVWVRSGVKRGGHRHVSVKVKGRIPAGDTMLLAFSGHPGPGSTALGAGGIIAGRVPRCVSLPSAP